MLLDLNGGKRTLKNKENNKNDLKQKVKIESSVVLKTNSHASFKNWLISLRPFTG